VDDGWPLVGTIVVIVAVAVVVFAVAEKRRRFASVADEMQVRSLERDFMTSDTETISRDP
jgi:hypothetical protein